jgi:hypothetical protein
MIYNEINGFEPMFCLVHFLIRLDKKTFDKKVKTVNSAYVQKEFHQKEFVI